MSKFLVNPGEIECDGENVEGECEVGFEGGAGKLEMPGTQGK